MGMFDSFYFAAGFLPDCTSPPNAEFQTKSLRCHLDKWYIGSDGIAINKEDPTLELNDSAVIYNYDDTIAEYYKVMFLNNKLIYAKKIGDEGDD